MISISNKVSAARRVLWLTQFITMGPSCHLSHYPQWWSPRVCKEIDLMASLGPVILQPFNSAAGRSIDCQFQLNDLQNQTKWDMTGTNQHFSFFFFVKHKRNEFESKLFVNVDCWIILNSEISSARFMNDAFNSFAASVLVELIVYTIQNLSLSSSPLLSFMFVHSVIPTTLADVPSSSLFLLTFLRRLLLTSFHSEHRTASANSERLSDLTISGVTCFCDPVHWPGVSFCLILLHVSHVCVFCLFVYLLV